MGIMGLLPFIEKASRRTNVSEFNGCTVAIDSYCWLHKGAFACADKLVRGEETDIHIRYCIKYVTMLLSKNIKPILVFDGRHLPAKAMTESKRRESRDISKKRAAELLSLGKIEEARSYMRRSVDITHAMALSLIKECRKRNVDCIVAPYEADAQLAYLNIRNIAHVVITEDSDLILFGCTKVLFKMDLDGAGTLVDTTKLPLAMKCPIEHYTFDKFRQMCIMSGCDYLASLPGIGLAKARQFVTATQDSNFANALKKLPSFYNKSSLVVTDEYRENFLKAEATFKHQYVYDPLARDMVRLTEPDDEDVEQALCVNAGELLDPKTAFQLALGNLDPFSLKKMDDWHPDYSSNQNEPVKTNSWKEKGVAPHPSIWSKEFAAYLNEPTPWLKKEKKPEPILAVPTTRPRKVVNLVSKFVPETQDQDESLSIETLSTMYCTEPANKKQKINRDNEFSETFTQHTENLHNRPITDDATTDQFSTRNDKSPILENKERSFRKCLKTGSYSVLKKLSRFPRTVLDNDVIESKFFSSTEEIHTNDNNVSKDSITIEESPERTIRNPFKKRTSTCVIIEVDEVEDSQKENSPRNKSPHPPHSPIFEPSPKCRTGLKTYMDVEIENTASEESVIENTYPMETLITPTASQASFGASPTKSTGLSTQSQPMFGTQPNKPRTNMNGFKKSAPRLNGVKKSPPLPSNQPTLLSKFGFQKNLSIETLSTMYCTEPANKKQKINRDNEFSETFTQHTENLHNRPITDDATTDQFSTRNDKSPILENKERSFRKCLKTGSYSVLKKLSRFPRTVLDNDVIESKFFSSTEEIHTNDNNVSKDSITIEESPERTIRNPFKKRTSTCVIIEVDEVEDSQKENSPRNKSPQPPHSPIFEPSPKCRTGLKTYMDVEIENTASEESVIENTYPMETLITPTASQASFGASPTKSTGLSTQSQPMFGTQPNKPRTNMNGFKKSAPRLNGVKKSPPLPSNQPTLLSKFGFQKKPVLKR